MKYRDENVEQKIIERTLEILEKRGLRGWNMAELAEETGLAKNTMYRIIGSKEKLMQQIAEVHCERIYSRLTQILETGGEYFATLETLATTYAELSPSYFAEIFREFPRIETAIAEKNSQAHKKLIQYINRGKGMNLIRNDLSAESIFELLRAVGLYYSANESESERQNKIKFAFNCIFHGIMKDERQ